VTGLALGRPKKITFAEMCAMCRSVAPTIVCSHSIAISGDRWPDEVRLSDVEVRFICSACGKRGADVHPDFNWKKEPVAMMGYR
jgi:hypothetical protein